MKTNNGTLFKTWSFGRVFLIFRFRSRLVFGYLIDEAAPEAVGSLCEVRDAS